MLGRIALVLASIVLGLLVLELGLRLVEAGPQALVEWPNYVREQRIASRSHSGAQARPDPQLGFIGLPGYASAELNNDARGFRVTPAPAGLTLKEPPIVAVGGSFTQGAEVADDETLPSYLQALLGRRVINAGVIAYGVDQMVMRAEILAATEKPAAIVLGFGYDNLRRSEMSRVWGIEKPYFETVNGELVLRNVPVPPSPDPATTLDVWQRLFGRSMLVDFVLKRLKLQYEWSLDHVRIAPPGEGARQACLLFKRLARLELPVVVVAEYDPYLWTDPPYMREQRQLMGSVLQCAAAVGFATVDPFDEIDRAMRTVGRDLYYRKGEHFSPAGHQMVARLVAEKLR
jgi:GDSL-like Lipase/Acylhydrolase family